MVRADHTDQPVIDYVLDALRNQKSPGVEEILLVDSSPEGIPLQVASLDRVQWLRLRRSEFSYGRALNLGCASAKASVLVTINGHTIPVGRGWLDGLISALTESGAAAACGCQSGLWPSGRVLEPTVLTQENFGPPWWDGLSTANLAMPREVWQQYPFNESVPYGEDKEWGKRVVLSGNVILLKVGAVIFHSHPERRAREQLKHLWWRSYCQARFALINTSAPGLGPALSRGLRAFGKEVARAVYRRRGFKAGLAAQHNEASKTRR